MNKILAVTKRRDDMATCFLILAAAADVRNDNIPSRIYFSIKTISTTRFHDLVEILETQGLMEIARGVRRGSGSRNKFYLTSEGKKLVDHYRQSVVLLGFQERFPEIWMLPETSLAH